MPPNPTQGKYAQTVQEVKDSGQTITIDNINGFTPGGVNMVKDRQNGPVVLITGCSAGGIGHALCLELHKRGCRVWPTARRVTSMKALQDRGMDCLALDVNSADSCRAAIDAILQQEQNIDVLINNAGAGGVGPLLEFDADQATEVFVTNVIAPLRLTQLVVKRMLEDRRSANASKGLVVNIGSVVGNIHPMWSGIYNSTKAALHAWTKTMEMELAPLGVQVMLVAAGGVISGFGERQLDSYVAQPDSAYKPVESDIRQRASSGQAVSISTQAFASKLADAILARPMTQRPRYVSFGGRSLLFAIMAMLPYSITRYLLMQFGNAAGLRAFNRK